MSANGRYSRNEALFGAEGQARIARTQVAAVGLGGLGSHLAQQLAHLGVRAFALIDFDVVTQSSLNRLVGALDSDPAAGRAKVAVAERSIRGINPAASVRAFNGKVADAEAEPLIAAADVIFGCVDRDSVRLELLELCARHGKPYFDLASDTGGEGDPWYGGRVVLCHGDGCLICLDLLDQTQIRRDRMSPAERVIDERIYGVARAALGDTGPSVVSINGVVASLAVTEFMALVTGLRHPAGSLTYRADLGTVQRSLDGGVAGCYFCARWRGVALPTVPS